MNPRVNRAALGQGAGPGADAAGTPSWTGRTLWEAIVVPITAEVLELVRRVLEQQDHAASDAAIGC